MSALEQGLLFGVTAAVLVGTLIVFVAQFVRMNRRDRRDGDERDGDERRDE